MKKIISLILAVMLLVTLALAASSCSMESMTGYTRLRDHIKAVGGDEPVVTLDAAKVGLNSASVSVITTEEGEQYVCLIGYAVNTTSGTVYQATAGASSAYRISTAISRIWRDCWKSCAFQGMTFSSFWGISWKKAPGVWTPSASSWLSAKATASTPSAATATYGRPSSMGR